MFVNENTFITIYPLVTQTALGMGDIKMFSGTFLCMQPWVQGDKAWLTLLNQMTPKQFVCFLKEYTIERGKTTWLEGFKTILSVNLEFTLSTKFYWFYYENSLSWWEHEPGGRNCSLVLAVLINGDNPKDLKPSYLFYPIWLLKGGGAHKLLKWNLRKYITQSLNLKNFD